MKPHVFSRRFIVATLLIIVAGCGGKNEFKMYCSPAPRIISNPPLEATVDQLYVYYIDAEHECGLLPFICSDVYVIQMPPGAVFSTYPNVITWKPSISEVDRDVLFRIATVPDYCGDSVSQSWRVRVLPDTTPPGITNVYPSDGATNIPVSAKMGVTFTEAVDPRTVTTESYRVSGPGGPFDGSVEVNENYAIFTPSSYLPYSSTIAVTLTTAVQDLSGNYMASDYSWSFVTSEAPDLSAPTVPAELTATRVTGREVDLTWAASIDDAAVSGYILYRDDIDIQTIAGMPLSAKDRELNFGTRYCYSVTAYDSSGNESAQSDPLCVTTLDFSPGVVALWGKVITTVGTEEFISVPDVMPELSSVIAIAAESNELLAVDSDGGVWQTGAVSTRVPNLNGATAIAKGWLHSIAAASDGTAWAWGSNLYGQLGDGTVNSSAVPVRMLNLNQVRAVAGGTAHTIALESDGTVWATGANFWGQLGDGTTTWQTVPVQVRGLSHVVAIAAKSNQSLALKSDGTVWMWGGTSYYSYYSTPHQVVGISDAVSISQGEGFCLAADIDGKAWGWGLNTHGQLGDGTTIYRERPVQVMGLAKVVAVAAGTSHSLALKADGTVWAWGYNGDGALGDGTRINKTEPIEVLLLSDVKAIAVGTRVSFALIK